MCVSYKRLAQPQGLMLIHTGSKSKTYIQRPYRPDVHKSRQVETVIGASVWFYMTAPKCLLCGWPSIFSEFESEMEIRKSKYSVYGILQQALDRHLCGY